MKPMRVRNKAGVEYKGSSHLGVGGGARSNFPKLFRALVSTVETVELRFMLAMLRRHDVTKQATVTLHQLKQVRCAGAARCRPVAAADRGLPLLSEVPTSPSAAGGCAAFLRTHPIW